MSWLPRADKEQCGAFIVSFHLTIFTGRFLLIAPNSQRDEKVLIVWSDDLDSIVTTCNDFDEKLMKLVWRSRPKLTPATTATSLARPSEPSSSEGLNEKAAGSADDAAAAMLAEKSKPSKRFKWSFGWKLSAKAPEAAPGDVEKGEPSKEARPIRLFAPFYNGLGVGLSICE